jgi:hypothetical protein
MSDTEKMDSTEIPNGNSNENMSTEDIKKVEPIESNESDDPIQTTGTNGGLEIENQPKEETKDEKMDASSVKSDQQQVSKNY